MMSSEIMETKFREYPRLTADLRLDDHFLTRVKIAL